VEGRHFYAFSTRVGDPIPVYERTFGTEEAADRWIEGDPAKRFVTVGMVPKKFFY
jgi:hypothetical protein